MVKKVKNRNVKSRIIRTAMVETHDARKNNWSPENQRNRKKNTKGNTSQDLVTREPTRGRSANTSEPSFALPHCVPTSTHRCLI